ncbi:unnamed protein product [Protopolystoma xenopodis]|uniref:Uncharacterized protein n=1 Tax=Protopolystoma xenopodis TaxID=117903 RepID=A0A3S5FC22_9PLAT|nr:unnamed protein product [Protopolystoma xenopodis]
MLLEALLPIPCIWVTYSRLKPLSESHDQAFATWTMSLVQPTIPLDLSVESQRSLRSSIGPSSNAGSAALAAEAARTRREKIMARMSGAQRRFITQLGADAAAASATKNSSELTCVTTGEAIDPEEPSTESMDFESESFESSRLLRPAALGLNRQLPEFMVPTNSAARLPTTSTVTCTLCLTILLAGYLFFDTSGMKPF